MPKKKNERPEIIFFDPTTHLAPDPNPMKPKRQPKREREMAPPGSDTCNTLEKKVSDRAPSRKNHFFTYNNYSDEEVGSIFEVLQKFAYKGKFQSEIGENGTPHLQGMIWCKDKHRSTEFKLSKAIHWEALKDYHNKKDYCGKVGPGGWDGKHRYVWGFPRPLNILTDDKLYSWQRDILTIIQGPEDDRTVYWFWSKEGKVGKSKFAKYLVVTKNVSYICLQGENSDPKYFLMEQYKSDPSKLETVILDIPRKNGNRINYGLLEELKNGMIQSSKYEGGFLVFNPPHVIVFANEPPRLEELSADRWKITELFPAEPENVELNEEEEEYQ